MRYVITVLAAVTVAGGISVGVDPAGAAPASEHRVVARLVDDAPDTFSRVAREVEARGGEVVHEDPTLGFVAVSMVASDLADALGAVAAIRDVTEVAEDIVLTTTFTPNDAGYGLQWGPPAIGVPEAWDTGRGSHALTVGIIDTGINYTHSDIAPNYCRHGPNFITPHQPPRDDHGHGTHVAGTVAAKIDNTIGVAGMADACLVSIKTQGSNGSGFSSHVASGMRWAADNDVDVVNMSIGADGSNFLLEDAAAYAWNRGVLLVAAAGNDFCTNVDTPAAIPEVVAVAALANSNSAASYSDCGPEVELAGPGSTIFSTDISGGYSTKSGTSMASPHVAGVAALVWDRDTSLTNAQVRCLLDDTADDLGASGRDQRYGWGRVDADGAVGRLGVGSVPSWPVCEVAPPPNDQRTGREPYLTANDVVVTCIGNLGGACFDVLPGDQTVSIALDDVLIDPVAGRYRFENPSGTLVGSGNFCGSVEDVPVPADAVDLFVFAGGPLRATLECGSPMRTATIGFIDVVFN